MTAAVQDEAIPSPTDVVLTLSRAEKDALVSAGWIPLGSSRWYVLQRPEQSPQDCPQ